MDSHVLSAMTGVIVGGIIPGVISYVTLKSQERKQHRELIFSAAVENFKQACEMARTTGGQVMPLDDFLIHMAKLSEIVINKKFDDSSVEKYLQQLNDLMKRIENWRLKTNPKSN